MTPKKTLPVAAAEGDRLETLRVLRDRLAAEIHNSMSARDTAALAKQLCDVLAQIDALAGGRAVSAEDSTFDELTRRRAGRRTRAPSRARAQSRQPG